MSEPLRLAMVGGGPGSFIGPVHRMAASLDGRFRLVAGAFSSDGDRSRIAGSTYGLPANRVYADWQRLIREEGTYPDGAQIVAIVTPNDLHLPIALAALEAGLHVVSDKPATATLSEALQLRKAVRASSLVYALTYTYSGYPLVREARARIARGELGSIRKVVVEYPQGWLAQDTDSKQAAWRLNPARAGVGGCIGDIGVHAFHLAEFVTGMCVESFVADLGQVVGGRLNDDDCNFLLAFAGGARGVLIASQISTGERNGLTIKAYGTQGGLIWTHERANCLSLLHPDGRTEILHAGAPGLEFRGRLPAGHPEGFIEAFATIYADIADAVQGERSLLGTLVPDIEVGVRSMLFIERAVEASGRRAGWTMLENEEHLR